MNRPIDIFERLRRGETVAFDDPESARLREASFVTRRLLLQLNQSGDAEELRALLSRIIGSEIDKSSALFPPFHVNYGKHTRIGKNVFINFDCVFLDLGGITIDDTAKTIMREVSAAITEALTWKKGVFDLEMVHGDYVAKIDSGAVIVTGEVTT